MHDWLLGYPKSGNTWMAHALHALLTGEGARTWDEVQYTVPNWDRVGFEAEPCPHGWVRGHCTPGVVASDVAERILYVVRHPGAVIASSFHARHREIHGEEIKGEDLIDGYTYNWLQVGGEPEYFQVYAGSWKDNVRWAKDPRTIFIRYEDMYRDPRFILTEVAKNFELEAHRVTLAVTASHHNRMRDLDTDGINVRGAEPDAWKRMMTREMRKQIEETFAKELEMLGYD